MRRRFILIATYDQIDEFKKKKGFRIVKEDKLYLYPAATVALVIETDKTSYDEIEPRHMLPIYRIGKDGKIKRSHAPITIHALESFYRERDKFTDLSQKNKQLYKEIFDKEVTLRLLNNEILCRTKQAANLYLKF